MKAKQVLILLLGTLGWLQTMGQCNAFFRDSIWSNPVLTVVADNVPGMTYNWSLWNGGGTITSNQNVAVVTISPGAVPTIVLRVTGAGCSNTYAKTIGRFLPPYTLPSIPAIGPTTVCGSGPRTYTAFYNRGAGLGSCYLLGHSVIGGSETWGYPNTWPENYEQATWNIEWNPTGTGKVITTYGLCSYPPSVVYCTTYVSLSCGVTGPKYICLGDTVGYQQHCPPGSTYSWSTQSGTILGGQSTDSILVTWNTPGRDTVVTIYNSSTCGLDTNYYPVEVIPWPTNTIQGDTNACALASDTFTTSTLPPILPPHVTNSWHVTGGGLNVSGSNRTSFDYTHGNGPTETIILTTNDHGCISRDTIEVNLYPSPVPPIPTQPLICTGDSVLLDAGPGYATYAWSTGSSLSAIYANSGSPYTVSVTEPIHNCLGTATAIPVMDTTCVWPGDANHDYVADLNDFLAIGVAFGAMGSPRPNALIGWMGQPATDWAFAFPSGENYKHADSDGDGLVDFPDTVSVSMHQGFTHVRTGTVTGGVPLRISPRIPAFAGQDSVELLVQLGSPQFPADSVYGMTFRLDYAPGDVFPGVVAVPSPSFMGQPGSALMDMQRESPNGGQLGWALVRTDHQPSMGHGEVGRLRMMARPSLWAGRSHVPLPLSISNCRLINHRGDEIPVTHEMDTVWLYDLSTVPAAEAISTQQMEITPNPVSEMLHLWVPGHQGGTCSIGMVDAGGRMVLHEERILPTGSAMQDLPIDVHTLCPGVYALRVVTRRASATFRVAVVR